MTTFREWRVRHPHPDHRGAVGETWTERESEEQAARYAQAGFTVESRLVTVGPWEVSE